MQTRGLTPTQHRELRRDGFTVVPQLFEPESVSRIRRAFERLEHKARSLRGTGLHEGAQFVVTPREGEDSLRIDRVVWCGGAEPALDELGASRRLLAIAGQVLDRRKVDQLINQAHFKFPGDGVDFPWHQDSVHRRYGTELWDDVNGRGSFLEIATAIDPVTEHNGPLQFIPGSHHDGHIPPDPESGELPQEAYDPSRAVTPLLDPGDAVLFGPFVIHGSSANEGSQPRRMFLNGFACPGANHRDYPGEGAGRTLRVPDAGASRRDERSVG